MSSFFTADGKNRGELSSWVQFSLLFAISAIFLLHLALAQSSTTSANFTYDPTSPNVTTNVSFNASGSCDPAYDCNYSWDFSDGDTAEGEVVGHSFDNAGDFDVNLTVEDNETTDTATETVTVESVFAPEAHFFYDPLEDIRVNETVTFNASESSDLDTLIGAYEWTIDGDWESNSVTFNRTFVDIGFHNVTLFVTDSEESSDGSVLNDTATKTVYVNNTPPFANFSFFPDEPRVSTLFTLNASASYDLDALNGSTAGGILENESDGYLWDVGENGTCCPSFPYNFTRTGRAINLSYSEPGDYEIVLRVVDKCGAGNITIREIRVWSYPIPDFFWTPAEPVVGMNETAEVTFNASPSESPSGRPIQDYQWDMDNDTFLNDSYGITANYTYNVSDASSDPQNWPNIGLKIIDNESLHTTIYKQVSINARPIANFTYDPHRPLPGVNITFNASPSYDLDNDINFSAVVWSLDNDSIYNDGQGDRTINKSFPKPGNYTVGLNVTDDHYVHTASDVYRENVTINSRPVANYAYTPDKPIVGETTTFNATISTDQVGHITTYTWSKKDLIWSESTSTKEGAIHNITFSDFQDGQLTLIVTDNDGVKDNITRNISVYSRPVPNFTWSPDQPFRNQTITLNASNSTDADGNITSYEWDLNGDEVYNNATGNVTNVSFSDYGNHTIGLNITDNDNISGILRKNITVYVPPEANFSFNPSIPVINESVTFNASNSDDLDGDIVWYTWQVDDIDWELSGDTPVLTGNFSTPGEHNVKLTVKDEDDLTDNIAKNISVNYRPDANFTITPSSPRPNQTITFNASLSNDTDGDIVDYAWDLYGDGNYSDASGEINMSYYTEEGNYTVSLNVTDNEGAWKTFERNVTVKNIEPNADFFYYPSEPDTLDNVTFNASLSDDPDGQIVSYQWDLNQDGNYSDASNETFRNSFSSWGNYTVSLKVTDDNGAQDVTDKIIKVSKSGAYEWIREDTTLNDSVNCSNYEGHCLGLDKDDITLDCQGNKIIGGHHGYHGIHIDYWDSKAMDNITIKNCVLVNFSTGIYEDGAKTSQKSGYLSNNNIYRNNTIINSSQSGIELFGSVDTVVEENKIIASSEVLREGISVKNAERIYIGDNQLKEKESNYEGGSIAAKGLYLGETKESTLVGNELAHTARGVELSNSKDNLIVNQTITGVEEYGLYLYSNSTNNYLAYNDIDGPGNSQGVRLGWDAVTGPVTDNLFLGNTLSSDVGIFFDDNAHDNRFYLNQIDSDSNSVSSNAQNTLNFFNSTDNLTYEYNSTTNSSVVGNYWSGYTGDDGNNDGLGDTAYTIDYDRDDNFPLIAELNSYNFTPHADFMFYPQYPAINSTFRIYAGLSYDLGGSIVSYEWDLDGDGYYNDSTGIDANKSFSSLGNKTVGLNVTDDTGNSVTVRKNVTVNAVPEADFTYLPQYPVKNEDISFNASNSNDSDGIIEFYEWDLDGDGKYGDAEGNSPITETSFGSTGYYEVSLRVTDDRGTTEAVTKTIFVNPEPTADFTYEPGVPAEGEEVQFDASQSNDLDGSLVNYTWDFDNDGEYEEYGLSVFHTFLSPGDKVVRLNVTDDKGAWDVVNKTITVNALPDVNFSYSPQFPLRDEEITLDASQTEDSDGKIASYHWDTDNDGLFEIETTDAIANTNFGDYGLHPVTLKAVDDRGDSSTITRDIDVNAKPEVYFDVWDADSSHSCPTEGQLLMFSAAGTTDPYGLDSELEYSWDWDGDGSYDDASGQSSERTYSEYGSKDIGLEVTDMRGATSELRRKIYINARPEADFSYEYNETGGLLANETVNFTAVASDVDSPIRSYSWNFNNDTDFGEGLGINASWSFENTGSNPVSLKVTDDCGAKRIITKEITVNSRPVANFTYTNFSDAKLIQFTSNSYDPDRGDSVKNWRWDLNGNGNYTDAQDERVNYTYDEEGVKNVGLLVMDEQGAKDTFRKTLIIGNADPVVSFSWSPTLPKADEDAKFDASDSYDLDGTINKLSWFFPELESTAFDKDKEVTYAFNSSGIYSVTLNITDNNGAWDNITKNLEVVNFTIEANFTYSPQNPVTGSDIEFDASPSTPDKASTQYSWDLSGNGSYTDKENDKIFNHSYSEGGTKNVGLNVTYKNVSDTMRREIEVNDRPVANFSYSPGNPIPNETIELDGSLSSDDDGDIVDYAWDLYGGGNYSDAGGEANKSSYEQEGNYTVSLKVTDDEGTSDIMNKTIEVSNASYLIVSDTGSYYNSIQAAIDNASRLDTIKVWSGSYPENLTVDKELSLLGVNKSGGKPVIEVENSSNSVRVTADGVHLIGFKINSSESLNRSTGIELSANNSLIANNTIINGEYGIKISETAGSIYNTVLDNNNISNNREKGIHFSNVYNTTIKNNSITNNQGNGLKVTSSSDLALVNNTIQENDNYGATFYSSTNISLIKNELSSNTCGIATFYSQKIELYDNKVLSNQGNGLRFEKSSDITVSGNSVNRSGGILLQEVSKASLKENIVFNNTDGIKIDSSNRTKVIDTSLVENKGEGISCVGYSLHNLIKGNEVAHNSYGIKFQKSLINSTSSNNTVANNIVSNNKYTGVYFNNTYSLSVLNNKFYNNSDAVYLVDSQHNLIINNTLKNNRLRGLNLIGSSLDNKIYLNSFIGNNESTSLSGSAQNNSFSSPRSINYSYNGSSYTNYLGNYWDSYSGSDSDGNGVGDSSYPVNSDYSDDYPLVDYLLNYTTRNHSPVAWFTYHPLNPDDEDTVTLDGSLSYDLSGSLVNYSWDLNNDQNFSDASGQAVTHQFSSGDYQVSLKVSSADNYSHVSTKTISVESTSTSSSSDGGGGSGGGAGGISVSSYSITSDDEGVEIRNIRLDSGDSETFNLSDKMDNIHSFSVEAEENVSSGEILVRNIRSSEVDPEVNENELNQVYAYLNISSSFSLSGSLMFEVDKDWLEDRGLDEAYLAHFEEATGVWEKLPTRQISQTIEYKRYRATISSLSLFAIVGTVSEEGRRKVFALSPGGTCQKLRKINVPEDWEIVDQCPEREIIYGLKDGACKKFEDELPEGWDRIYQSCQDWKDSKEAKLLIERAEQEISKTEGEAAQLLKEAKEEYAKQNYKEAEKLADEALETWKKKQGLPWTLIIIVIMASGLLSAVAIFLRRQKMAAEAASMQEVTPTVQKVKPTVQEKKPPIETIQGLGRELTPLELKEEIDKISKRLKDDFNHFRGSTSPKRSLESRMRRIVKEVEAAYDHFESRRYDKALRSMVHSRNLLHQVEKRYM